MNLVVQSLQPLSAKQCQTLATLVPGAIPIYSDPYTLRINGADVTRRTEISAYCTEQQLDCAFIPTLRLADFKVLAIDMDSTLITIECIDEIADFCGVKKEVSAITEAAMRGEIKDFDESLKRRVALLKGLEVNALERVFEERLRLTPGASALISRLRAAGLRTLLVSGGFTFFADKLKTQLEFDYAHANTLDISDNKLTGSVIGKIINAEAKAEALRELCAQLNVEPTQAMAIGDGANDLQMMNAAGLSIAFHAKPAVREAAHVALNFVGLDGVLKLFE